VPNSYKFGKTTLVYYQIDFAIARENFHEVDDFLKVFVYERTIHREQSGIKEAEQLFFRASITDRGGVRNSKRKEVERFAIACFFFGGSRV
jgi:hypothetical protein